MPKLTRIGALLLVNPEEARNEIRAAVRQNGGNTTHAAEHMGISHRHLCRLIDELGLDHDIDVIRRELGVTVVRPGEGKSPAALARRGVKRKVRK